MAAELPQTVQSHNMRLNLCRIGFAALIGIEVFKGSALF